MLPLLLCAATLSALVRSDDATLTFDVTTSSMMMLTHTGYLSVTIDAYSATPGTWEQLNADVFTDSIAVNLASHISPAYFRYGGTTADQLTYDVSSAQQSDLGYPTYPLNEIQWDAINQFNSDAQYGAFFFTVNALPRTSNGAWDSTNFVELLQYTKSKGFNIFGWELGNEPDLFPSTYNITITPQQLAQDYQTLRTVLNDQGFSSSNILGPALAYQTTFLNEFAEAIKGNNVVNHVTVHQYYGDGPSFNVADFYSVTVLDSLIGTLSSYQSAAQPMTSTGSELWLGETSSTYNAGTPGASMSYVAGFLWLDKLALAPYFGFSTVCRQDFWGGNYALFANNFPYPDYWTSVLFKQLVGRQALNVAGATQTGRMTRVYAFCTRNDSSSTGGGVVIVALNINTSPTTFTLQSSFPMYPRYEHHLTAPDGNLSSDQIQLNGVTLQARSDGSLPSLNGLAVTTNTPITLAATSYAFISFPDANAPACKAL